MEMLLADLKAHHADVAEKIIGSVIVDAGCRHSLPGFMRPFRTNSCLRHP
jgi:hypothetical protein